MLLWGLILEFPLHFLISSDPWIHDSSHWYFDQPSRILLELSFVLLALLPFFHAERAKRPAEDKMDE